eukprot:GHVO01037195.1.p2 GENE.GHVO01037195.1~~GHVO01037195.1.p2  ORF type:complete len:126 (+),score=10.69 GHVO01037195.1:89-466(+)
MAAEVQKIFALLDPENKGSLSFPTTKLAVFLCGANIPLDEIPHSLTLAELEIVAAKPGINENADGWKARLNAVSCPTPDALRSFMSNMTHCNLHDIGEFILGITERLGGQPWNNSSVAAALASMQ